MNIDIVQKYMQIFEKGQTSSSTHRGLGLIEGRSTLLKLFLTSIGLNEAVMMKSHAITIHNLDIQQTRGLTSRKSDLINCLIPFEIFML